MGQNYSQSERVKSRSGTNPYCSQGEQSAHQLVKKVVGCFLCVCFCHLKEHLNILLNCFLTDESAD